MSDNQAPELPSQDAGNPPSSATANTIEAPASKRSPTPGSSFFATSGGREMLDLVDSLRKLDRVSSTIPLPQIIVIGQQSSGKSSVLNAITGISFPVDTGMTTRFPTEIKLRRTNNAQTKVSFHPSPDPSRQEAFDVFEAHWKSEGVTLDRLPEVIAGATKTLKIGGTTSFSNETLILEICGPEQENLTLIDLPGLITSTKKNQDSGDIGYVANIVERYMKEKLAIMLAVFTGSTDFENQILMQKLKDNDYYSQRSLGVITAPDAIQANSGLEKDCLEHVSNQNLDLGHGWHVLRNLNSQEVKKNLDRNAVEKAFFETQLPWCNIDKCQVGYQALKKRLSEILHLSIVQALPGIEDQITKGLLNCERQLNVLGVERSTPQQQKEYLHECAILYTQEITGALDGNPQYRELTGIDVSLRARIRMRGETFNTRMSEGGRSWKLVPEINNNQNQSQRLMLINDVVGGKHGERPDTTKALCEADMLLWLSHQKKMHQGQEPSNLVNPLWAGELFKYQSRSWKDLAQIYINNVFDDVKEYVTKVVKTTFGKEISGRVWTSLVLPGMKQLKVDLDKKLSEICKPYFGRYPQTLNKRYSEILRMQQSKRPKNSGSSGFDTNNTSCYQILDTVDAMYDICSDVFIDNVQNLVIEHCLLDKLEALAGTSNFLTMKDMTLEKIAGESPGNKEIREQLTKHQEQYEKALNEIIPSLEARGFDRYDFPEKHDSFDHYALISSASPECTERKIPVESYQSRPNVHEEIFKTLLPLSTKAEAADAVDLNVNPSQRATPAQMHSRRLLQVTPQKNRRRRNVSESADRPHATQEVSDEFSSPSTVHSGSSERDSASSVSSYQTSPQPSVKASGGLSFIAPQRTATESSEY